MPIVMNPEDAVALRQALEPLTLKMKGFENSGDATLPLVSIALSLKRIADVMQRMPILTPGPQPMPPTIGSNPTRSSKR